MTKSRKCIIIQMNRANTFCNIQLHISSLMKLPRLVECAQSSFKHQDWISPKERWRSTNVWPIAPQESVLTHHLRRNGLAATTLIRTVAKWSTSTQSKRRNFTTLKNTKCWIQTTRMSKTWKTFRIAPTSILKMKINLKC